MINKIQILVFFASSNTPSEIICKIPEENYTPEQIKNCTNIMTDGDRIYVHYNDILHRVNSDVIAIHKLFCQDEIILDMESYYINPKILSVQNFLDNEKIMLETNRPITIGFRELLEENDWIFKPFAYVAQFEYSGLIRLVPLQEGSIIINTSKKELSCIQDNKIRREKIMFKEVSPLGGTFSVN